VTPNYFLFIGLFASNLSETEQQAQQFALLRLLVFDF